jgi:anoctamin-8
VVAHDAVELAALRRSWLGELLAPQPLLAIRNYFGVQVALYFAWMGTYTRL